MNSVSAAIAALSPLPAGPHGLASARPEPDLAAHGHTEVEYLAGGRATSYRSLTEPALRADGRFALTADAEADFTTRVVVRRPVAERFSGTLVVEWLNVSSGLDAAPGWIYAGEEVLRSGHAWAGVSVQHAGVEGGGRSVAVGGMPPPPGLRGADPERYGALHHPGDAFAYDIYTQVARAVRELTGARRLIAMGESQAATCLTTYANGVQPITGLADGFLLHSRLGVAAPLGEPGLPISLEEARTGPAVAVRDDLVVPVLILQAEGDLFDRIGYLPARQPDGEWLRLWEVAGAAHADRYLIGEFEEFLGCDVPVNRGQQWAVVRAALRALDTWVRDGVAAPSAARLETTSDGFATDEHGLVRGGVRTPVVDVPVEVVSGRVWPGASVACGLFGSSTPLAGPAPYESRADYLARYEAACDAMISAGFALADDRADLLAEARADLVATDV
ncbi:alpha/beta hydrolase domain-containing protein [Nocardioides sp. R-C-SC26]|uniref:alpha/beta hydrolase domain-containing protein n=1 Tax=Nocardioides sp. R-C-SC26 TaxID=2870414 RepID=UPI001E4C239C|nr:alpha/beta hydrolase domain-containing protein [Nocardioides sp. R-C-SC26]